MPNKCKQNNKGGSKMRIPQKNKMKLKQNDIYPNNYSHNYSDYEDLMSDEDLYDKKARTEMLDNDELSPGEDGFLEGYSYDYNEEEPYPDKYVDGDDWE